MKQTLMHKHYIGTAHTFEIVNKDDSTAGKYVRPDVTILKTFFIDDTVNANGWQATWEGLKKDAEELPGTPLVLKEDLEHPKFSVQKYFDRGTIFDYDIDEEKHQIIVYVRITDPTVVERIRSGELEYVSPAVIPKGSEYMNPTDGVDVLERTLPLHLAIVGDPAYGKEKAKMTHLCSGDGEACYHRLKVMKASKVKNIIKREHELLDKGVPEDEVHEILKKEFGSGEANVDALTQIPYIKKMINKTAKLASILNKINHDSDYYVHDGHRGVWINVQGMDVFVAANQSIASAMKAQCGCTSLMKLNVN